MKNITKGKDYNSFLSRLEFDSGLANERNVRFVIGLDEVGYGCFAGPLVIGAVVMDIKEIKSQIEVITQDYAMLVKVRDSKKIKDSIRERIEESLIKFITSTQLSINFGFGVSSVDEINNSGVTKSHDLATLRALDDITSKNPNLDIKDSVVLIDGNKVDNCLLDYNVTSVIKGDDKSFAVGSASILAKNHRDRMLVELSKIYPEYNFYKNKGYGTKEHRDAIKKHGLTPEHRIKYCRNLFDTI